MGERKNSIPFVGIVGADGYTESYFLIVPQPSL